MKNLFLVLNLALCLTVLVGCETEQKRTIETRTTETATPPPATTPDQPAPRVTE